MIDSGLLLVGAVALAVVIVGWLVAIVGWLVGWLLVPAWSKVVGGWFLDVAGGWLLVRPGRRWLVADH